VTEWKWLRQRKTAAMVLA